MTLLGTSGGECVAAVVPSFLPTSDFGTVTVTQDGAELTANMTMEATGLACRYSGSATLSNVAMNATACDRHGLLVETPPSCAPGLPTVRMLRLVGSSVAATWNGNQITGRTTTTYNVFIPDREEPGEARGALVATHSFTATRR